MKRVVTIQDISCVGKCSLTVALPIISACGVETAVIPTAVLSTHTAFHDFTFHDLTDEVERIARHWRKEGIGFDAIYTGYLGSFEQLELVSRFIDRFRSGDNLVLVDPAMGDNGALYKGFTPDFAAEMAGLCGRADVIVPNLTEATCMLGRPYVGEDYDEGYIRELLRDLAELGARQVVLTGVSFTEEKLGVMAYDREKKRYFSYCNEKLPASFHGTGDVFASAVTGVMMRGRPLEQALEIAVDYTLESIKKTVKDPEHRWYGVNFEEALPMLVDRLHRAEEN